MPDQNSLIMMGDLLSGGQKVAGAITQSNALAEQDAYQQTIFEFNSGMATLKAKEALITGELAAGDVENRTTQQVGRIKTQFAGSGIVSNTGTAEMAVEQTGAIGAHDALLIQLNAQREALGYKTQATEQGLGADLEHLASQNKQRNTLWGGIEGGLADASQGFKNQFPVPPPNLGGPADSGSIVQWGNLPNDSGIYPAVERL